MLAAVTDAHFVPPRPGSPRGEDLVVLTGADLTVADVEAVARHGIHAALDVHARERMQEARDVIAALVERGEVVSAARKPANGSTSSDGIGMTTLSTATHSATPR